MIIIKISLIKMNRKKSIFFANKTIINCRNPWQIVLILFSFHLGPPHPRLHIFNATILRSGCKDSGWWLGGTRFGQSCPIWSKPSQKLWVVSKATPVKFHVNWRSLSAGSLHIYDNFGQIWCGLISILWYLICIQSCWSATL